MYSIVFQTIFHEYLNKHHKIDKVLLAVDSIFQFDNREMLILYYRKLLSNYISEIYIILHDLFLEVISKKK